MSTTNTLQPIIGVCGPSGSGKSSSLEHLPPQTIILDMERKGFPYHTEKAGHVVVPIGDTFDTNAKLQATGLGQFRKLFRESLTKKPPVIVLEGFTSLTTLSFNLSEASGYKGYDLFRYYNKWIRDLMEFIKNDVCPVIITGISEVGDTEVAEEGGGKSNKSIVCFAVTTGNEMKGKIEPHMLLVLHTKVVIHRDKANEHYLVTQTDGINTAKSPAWLKLPKLIPNDLGPVIQCLKEGKSWEQVNKR